MKWDVASRYDRVLILALLAALSVLAFWPSLQAGFLSDDSHAIVTNPFVVGPFRPADIFTHFSAGWWGVVREQDGGYRPLATLSFALNYQAGALHPAGYHAVNLLLHAIVCWLVYCLGLRLGLPWRASLLSALLFCLLPLHTEAVVWTVGRAELLCSAAFLTALLLLLGYRNDGGVAGLVAAAGFFLLAMLSKENAVTLLAVPLLSTLLLPRDGRRRDGAALLSLLAATAFYMALRAHAGTMLPPLKADELDNPLSVLSWPSRLAGAISVLGRYLQLSFWPYPLSVDYSYNALGIGPGFVADSRSFFAIGCSALFAWAAWRSRQRTPALTFSLLLSLATYSVVSNTVVTIGTIMGERLFYLPSAGLCLAGGLLMDRAVHRYRRAAVVLLTAMALIASAVDVQRAKVWRTPVSLFQAAVAAYPSSARAHMELATAYGHRDSFESAKSEFELALAIKPDYAAAWYNLGNLHARRGSYDQAVRAYRRAVREAPLLTSAWYNLGMSERLRRHNQDALTAFNRAVALSPDDTTLRMSQADTLLVLRRWGEAIEAYTIAAQLGADPGAVKLSRGLAKEGLYGCAAALPDYLAAVRLTGPRGPAVGRAATCLQAVGRNEEAKALLRRADQVANNGAGR